MYTLKANATYTTLKAWTWGSHAIMPILIYSNLCYKKVYWMIYISDKNTLLGCNEVFLNLEKVYSKTQMYRCSRISMAQSKLVILCCCCDQLHSEYILNKQQQEKSFRFDMHTLGKVNKLWSSRIYWNFTEEKCLEWNKFRRKKH